MGEPIYMRKATLDDLDAVYEIIENARQLLREVTNGKKVILPS